MLKAPDGTEIYSLLDLMFWMLANKEDAKILLGSIRLYEWLLEKGYKDLAEKSKFIDDVDEFIREIKRIAFKKDNIDLESKDEAILEFIRFYIK